MILSGSGQVCRPLILTHHSEWREKKDKSETMWRRRGSSLVWWITDPQTASRDSIGLRKAGVWGEGGVLLCGKIPHTWNTAGLSGGTLMWGPVAIYTCAWGLDSLSHTLKPQTAGITQGKALNQQPLHTRERGGGQHDWSWRMRRHCYLLVNTQASRLQDSR